MYQMSLDMPRLASKWKYQWILGEVCKSEMAQTFNLHVTIIRAAWRLGPDGEIVRLNP